MPLAKGAISATGEGRHACSAPTRRLLPALATAPITALLTVVTCVSYPAVIFSGALSGYYAVGVGLAFVSAIVLTLLVSLTSSYPGSLAYAQAEPAVIIAALVQGMAATLIGNAAADEMLPMVLATVSISSILCGLCVATLGWLRCGDLVRFLPLPVVGGFLGGVGYLLVEASLSASIGPALSSELPGSLLRSEAAAHWLPGIGFGAALWILQERRSHFLNLPVVLGVMVTLFWVIAALSGTAPRDLTRSGWLYGGLPGGHLWSIGQHIAVLDLVPWQLLPGHALEFVTLLVVTTIAMLLTANSIELSVGRDIDLNHELRWLGLGNLLAGLLGALPGYHSTSGSILTHKLGTPWRLVGALTAGLCLVALLIGPAFLSVMPKMVASTVLFYVGLGLMVDWLYKTWSRMHPADYFVLALVFGFVAFVGLIEGLGVGIAAGLAIFVLRYSRIDAVRNAASGATLRSNLERPEATNKALRRLGEGPFILTLQGYIFFGTSHKLLTLIRRRMRDPEKAPLRFLVLDFQLVSGLDSSAAASFTKLARYATELGFAVVLTGVPDHLLAAFGREGLLAGGGLVRVFRDLDRALEWTEDRSLEREQLLGSNEVVPIERTLAAVFSDAADRSMFQRHLRAYRGTPSSCKERIRTICCSSNRDGSKSGSRWRDEAPCGCEAWSRGRWSGRSRSLSAYRARRRSWRPNPDGSIA